MADFHFKENESDYQLSDSLGNGCWAFWSKSHFTYEQALALADRKVGHYIRTTSRSKRVRYTVDKKEE